MRAFLKGETLSGNKPLNDSFIHFSEDMLLRQLIPKLKVPQISIGQFNSECDFLLKSINGSLPENEAPAMLSFGMGCLLLKEILFCEKPVSQGTHNTDKLKQRKLVKSLLSTIIGDQTDFIPPYFRGLKKYCAPATPGCLSESSLGTRRNPLFPPAG